MNPKACQIILSVLLCVALYGSCQAQSRYEEDECKVWSNISDYIVHQDKMTVQCNKNPQCTGVDCSGVYTMSVEMVGGLFDVDLCFGIFIHPCAPTTELSVYIELLKPTTSSFNRVFTGNDSVVVPGSQMDVPVPLGRAVAEGVLDVTMAARSIHGKNYVLAGVRFRMRVTVAGQTFWPTGSEVTLIPNVMIPIPPCEKSVITPTHAPRTCDVGKVPKRTTTKAHSGKTIAPGPHTGTPTGAPPPSYLFPGTPCTVNTMGSCNNSEYCHPDPANPPHGRCVCGTTAQFSMLLRKCVPVTKPATTTAPVFPYPEMDAQKSGNSKVIIIASCSVAGVVLVAAILLGVVFRYRALRARYANHQPLATEEFQDDDEPLVI